MGRNTWLLSVAGVAAIGGVVALGVVGWMVFQPGPYGFARGRPVALSEYTGPSPAGMPIELAQADAATRGEYVARMADCEACHTTKGGQPFAGGRGFVLPFGTIYTPNITPDPETGIGKWSDAQLIDCMLQHPILINRPIVVTPLGTRLCRPSEAVLDILPQSQRGAFNKEDGEAVVDAEGRRV